MCEVRVRESVYEVRACTNVWEVCSVCAAQPSPSSRKELVHV